MPTSTPQARQTWLRVYQQLGSVSLAARHCGIARSTLHRWLKRKAIQGLTDYSRRPHRLAGQTTSEEVIGLMLDIRERFHFGKLRICSHLLQHHSLRLSPSTVARILHRHECQPLKRYRKEQPVVRYARPVPGDRLQLDLCKIAPVLYQNTAIDDCSRYKIVCLCKCKTAANSLDFWSKCSNSSFTPFSAFRLLEEVNFLLSPSKSA